MQKKPSKEEAWICKKCEKRFIKESDKLMECDYCQDRYCITCLDMSITIYKYHTQSSNIWLCDTCTPKVKEVLRIEKDIEERCNAYYQKFQEKCLSLETRCSEMEELIETKCSLEQIEDLVEAKFKRLIADKTQLLPNNDSNIQGNVEELVTNKIAENEKDILERKSRERNTIFFNLQEPNTNVIAERETADRELIGKVLSQLNIETEEEFTVEKVIRLGVKHTQPDANPRPVRIVLSTIEGKRALLKNGHKLRESDNDTIKKISISNDLIPKDRETEKELVKEKVAKNLKAVGNWKYVIRGPPGDRQVKKIRN